MAIAPNRPKPVKTGRGIEWTTIPVWYVYAGGGAIILILAVGGFLVYQALFGPKNKALRAIARAEAKHEEASRVARPGEHDKLLAMAEKKLDEADASAGQGQWDLATLAARESEEHSQEILDAAGGDRSPSVASFKRMSGTIEVKKANATQWVIATPDTALGASDLVRTDVSSRCEIIYKNGTKIVVDPNSLIQIMRPEGSKDSRTKVETGQTLISSGRIGENLLQTPSGVEVNVSNETEAGLTTDSGTGETSVTVAQGTATVRRGSEAVKLENAETVQVSESTGIGTVEKLPERPRPPENLQRFEYEEGGTSLATLRWEPVPEAVKYLVEAGRDPLLAGRDVENIEVTKSSFVMQSYPDGDYYWRVYAIDAAGRRSLPTPIQVFRIGPKGGDAPVERIPPPSLVIETITPVGTTVILKGRTDPNVSLTVDGEAVEVKADGTFHSVTSLREDGRNEVVVTARNALGGARRTRIFVNAEYF